MKKLFFYFLSWVILENCAIIDLPIRENQRSSKPIFVDELVLECEGQNVSLGGMKQSRHCSEIEERIRDDLREKVIGSLQSFQAAKSVKISVKYEYSVGSFLGVLLSSFTFLLIPHRGTFRVSIKIGTNRGDYKQESIIEKEYIRSTSIIYFPFMFSKEQGKILAQEISYEIQKELKILE